MAMASLFQAPTSISSSLSKPKLISSALRIPGYLKKPLIIVPKKLPSFDKKKVAIDEFNRMTTITNVPNKEDKDGSIITLKLYTLLEVINDRIEMHQNVKEQRDNWNSLLLNSLNMITLTAATMAGLAGADEMGHFFGLKASSTFLFAASTGILLIMNKIQPSQLVQEQRNAVRLFKKLQTKIQTSLSLQTSTKKEVEYAMEEVLALDRAYPLPLLGTMLEKFPKKFESAKWWPSSLKRISSPKRDSKTNGWNVELEEDMREIVGIIKRKDIQDYARLGNKALKLNKTLAMLGPSLLGIATIGSALSGHAGPWAGVVAALAGSMASVVNTIEHGGQVGMVFEMYRNCAGLFTLLGEMAESNLEESDLGKRENGELFEMKVALYLGRNLNELRDLADKSRTNGGDVDGFASKLF